MNEILLSKIQSVAAVRHWMRSQEHTMDPSLKFTDFLEKNIIS